MSHKVEYARDLLKACFLPELQQDLDSVSIQNEQFTQFHQALEAQLPLLYDFVQQQEQWLFANNETEVQEVRACLLVLLSEITACQPEPVYKLHNEKLLKNAGKLLKQQTQFDGAVDELIFKHYQSKLAKDSWKRHLGSVHGFLRFLDFRYNEADRSGEHKMNSQWLHFCLSVGLCVRECHEPAYKQLGTRVFLLMLHHGRAEDIQTLNIHSVIYDAVFKDVHYMDSVVATADIWHCLCKCLDYYNDIDSLSWNRSDDMIEALLRNITLSSDNLISICLLKFITKLCVYFTINHDEIEANYTADLSQRDLLERCRFACAANSSYTAFRWAKSILNTCIVESHKLMQSPTICRQLLLEMHRCYMVCIVPIDLPIIEAHLPAFFEKFTAVLMEVIALHKQHKDIVQLSRDMIETFHLQLQRSSYCDDMPCLSKFRVAFEKLLQHV